MPALHRRGNEVQRGDKTSQGASAARRAAPGLAPVSERKALAGTACSCSRGPTPAGSCSLCVHAAVPTCSLHLPQVVLGQQGPVLDLPSGVRADHPHSFHTLSLRKMQLNRLGFSLLICNHFPPCLPCGCMWVTLMGVLGTHKLFPYTFTNSHSVHFYCGQAHPLHGRFYWEALRGGPHLGERCCHSSFLSSSRV